MGKYKSILDARKVMIDYTSDQKKALLKIQDFIKSDDMHFLLVGNAGTGKTTIAENIATYVKSGILAPTNAAIKRLKDKFMSDDIPINRFTTLHQSLYGAPCPDTGMFIPKDGLQYYKVYIVDESSMIEEKLLKDLLKAAKLSGRKIIFMGDDFQLEPVGKDPVLFNWEKSNPLFKEKWRFKLNEVKRNDGVILSVATRLRLSSSVPQILDYNVPEFRVVPRFTSELPLDISHDSDFVVLVSTNKRRMTYNEQIRNAKFEEDAKEIFVDGERLISVSNQKYMNGEMYTIRHPKLIEAFVESINLGSLKYPDHQQYRFYLIEHEVEGVTGSFTTLLVPKLDKPSLHSSQLMSAPFIFRHHILTEYNEQLRKRLWNNNVNIATYGYATSVHKSQGNEWDNVYIDCDWLSDKWNQSRWLYTAITRAKKKVELKSSRYFKLIPRQV